MIDCVHLPVNFDQRVAIFIKFKLNDIKMPAADQVQQDVPMNDVEQEKDKEEEEEVERFISIVSIASLLISAQPT